MMIVGFLGWLCAGVHMSITQLVGQSAAIDLLGRHGAMDGLTPQHLNQPAEAVKVLVTLPSPAHGELFGEVRPATRICQHGRIVLGLFHGG